jgi:hypothetical protein
VGDDVASASTASRGSSKVMLSQFSSPRIKRIANIGNRSMRRHAALIEAFPVTQDKESTTWDIIVAGCKSNALLAKRLGQLDKDVAMKDMLVNYVSANTFATPILLIIALMHLSPSLAVWISPHTPLSNAPLGLFTLSSSFVSSHSLVDLAGAWIYEGRAHLQS